MSYSSAASSFSQVITAFSNSSSLPKRLPSRNSLNLRKRWKLLGAIRYCETLRKLRRAIQNRRRGMLSVGIVLPHDNALPHTDAATQELMDQFGWEIFNHPP
ncbi:hypothetical protein AVEN_212203-1 [Araneus ventricosus]|uniref:Histone-lysine N-methyltransferase SETMAR n=1 Tax=Araneus ventricosus TaxID=182803 RepID=A0A4Y2NYK9_ARAVE|nr:hypothetical protein AVEN_43142-1 [Araneus ventricosus]GBN42844.1 hypothetical protein AVEN_119922-1 [Araneus ventricosus]GBN42860.1 hypothetical protein AVEN_186622-1 [Araneus ventricosus]GBN42866.1 hypothetical protein AVEN_212203-1 [Araneus ventricosus]